MYQLPSQSASDCDHVLWPIRQYGCIDGFATSCRDFGLMIRKYTVIALEGLGEVIRQIFQACMECMCCCRKPQSSFKEPQEINGKITIIKSKNSDPTESTTQTNTQPESKNPEEALKKTAIRSHSFSDDSDDDIYGDLILESSSEYEVELPKTSILQFPKAPISITQNKPPVAPVLPKTEKSSSKVNEIATRVLDEKKLDELIAQLDQFSENEGDLLNLEEDQDYFFDDNGQIVLDEKYYILEEKVFESTSSKVQNAFKQSLQEACVSIKDEETPASCANTFYANLERAIVDFSQEEKLELVCFLISNAQEIIKAEITKTVRPSLKSEQQSTCSKAEAQEKLLAKFYGKRIESLQVSFFGPELSIFIGEQIFADNPNSVQQIITHIQDCGKYEIDKIIEILSQIMTKLYIQLQGENTIFTLENLHACMKLMQNLEDQGARIQSQAIQIDVLGLSIPYATLSEEEDDEESFSRSNDVGNGEPGDYHENAMAPFKAYTALLNTKKLEFSDLQIMLSDTAKNLENLRDSHFLYKALKHAFGFVLDSYIDALMARKNIPKQDTFKKIQLSYDAIAKKLNCPTCPESKLLLDLDFGDKYAALLRLEGYSSKQLEINSFVEMLSDTCDLIKNIDSTHLLHSRLRKAFDAIIAKYTDCANIFPHDQLNKIKGPYARLSKILGCEIVEMVVDTSEAAQNDPEIVKQLIIENFNTLRKETLARVKQLKFDLDLSDAEAVAQTWEGYFKSLLQYMPRDAAVMMLLLTFQKELNLKGLPQLLEDRLGWEEYLKVLSSVGSRHISKIRDDYGAYLDTFLVAGLSETEAFDLLSAICENPEHIK